MEVAGVDGCPGGWLVVKIHSDGPKLRPATKAFRAASFLHVLASTEDCAAVGVDIPIGLSDHEYWRKADLAARELLGPRKSSVFPAPVRATLAAIGYGTHRESYARARELSLQACGKSMSCFAHGILKKIGEVNSAMTQDLQDRIVEVHPEVSFLAMADEPMAFSKKKPRGLQERRIALSKWFTDLPVETPPHVAEDDVLDSYAAAWTAHRFALKMHSTLPATPPKDGRGLRMEIVY